VHNFVRAQTKPYPGAFTHLPDGRRARIWRTEIEARIYIGAPGAVAERNEDGVVVTCGDGAVRIIESAIDDDVLRNPGQIFDSLRLRLR
jgi:methionyl-tRNA formyltransferase